MENPKGDFTDVVFVRRHFAKKAKEWLEERHVLDKRFRMTPSLSEDQKDSIAIPVRIDANAGFTFSSCDGFLATGRQFCPYSTSVLGNNQLPLTPKTKDLIGDEIEASSPVEHAICKAIQQLLPSCSEPEIWTQIRTLSPKCCPKRLELLGDDRTLVIPRQALSFDEEHSFSEWLDQELKTFRDQLLCEVWEQLASFYKSPRIVRKGDILPESGTRESNYKIVWPLTSDDLSELTGPESPGWITVTEQGIRQSFDLTRVMFSRGNITEKVRFGKMVRPNETVLDMYGGIGYFTLPALVHGKAKHVYVCEWNPYAVQALSFNLEDNGVSNRATVFQGDCRELVAQHGLVHKMDRVSLGLLPSSEGGWETAVSALKPSGGWLHIHGNVLVEEVSAWALWICSCLANLAIAQRNQSETEESSTDSPYPTTTVVECRHVEKVKSFAPNINHYVADVYIGPTDETIPLEKQAVAAVTFQNGHVTETIPAMSKVVTPSCALSKNGVLHQDWMFARPSEAKQDAS